MTTTQTATMVDDGHDTRACGNTWPGQCTWQMVVAELPVGPVAVRRVVHTCQWDGVHRGPCRCHRCGTTTMREG
jgi:hypothetical protein